MKSKSYLSRKKEFNKILKDIKAVKIQGARNVAKAGLKAYSLFPSKKSIKKIIKIRPTEPMLFHVLNNIEECNVKCSLNHFDEAQEKINKEVFKLIKRGDVLFTHCHSTNVAGALIHAKKKGKKFEVYNTETRPLFQGRKTAKELRKNKIKVTMFVDSAVGIALSKEQGTKKVKKIFIGADALTKKGVINKVGSEVIARLAKEQKIPFYIVADSWKFTLEDLPIEQRKLNEVWDRAPKNIKIKNPAFEFVDKKYITGVVTELGLMKYGRFVQVMKKK